MTAEPENSPAAENLREYADRLTVLADELERIDTESSADEITYQLRDGNVAIIELTYHLAAPNSERPGPARRKDR